MIYRALLICKKQCETIPLPYVIGCKHMFFRTITIISQIAKSGMNLHLLCDLSNNRIYKVVKIKNEIMYNTWVHTNQDKAHIYPKMHALSMHIYSIIHITFSLVRTYQEYVLNILLVIKMSQSQLF